MLTSITIAQEMPEMSEEEMAAMQEYMESMAPNEHHEVYDYFIGEWDVLARMFMAGPGTEAAESAGVAVFSWIMGGRFMRETIDGEFMGQPYLSEGFFGYDNFRQQYTAVSVGNASTATGFMAGTYDAAPSLVNSCDNFQTKTNCSEQ